MNNERDIIMNTQPYAEDLGVDPSEDGDEIKAGSKTMIDASQMIAWLDAEIQKCNYTYHNFATYEVNFDRAKALQQCKQQLLKLLDGMGVKE